MFLFLTGLGRGATLRRLLGRDHLVQRHVNLWQYPRAILNRGPLIGVRGTDDSLATTFAARDPHTQSSARPFVPPSRQPLCQAGPRRQHASPGPIAWHAHVAARSLSPPATSLKSRVTHVLPTPLGNSGCPPPHWDRLVPPQKQPIRATQRTKVPVNYPRAPRVLPERPLALACALTRGNGPLPEQIPPRPVLAGSPHKQQPR
jgi:hypothetical protein